MARISEKKGLHLIDQHVGEQIRQCRVLAKMSQTALGDRIGVTFQQVQKYEKGQNRVSASTLLAIAEILEVPLLRLYGASPSPFDLERVSPAINAHPETKPGYSQSSDLSEIKRLLEKTLEHLEARKLAVHQGD